MKKSSGSTIQIQTVFSNPVFSYDESQTKNQKAPRTILKVPSHKFPSKPKRTVHIQRAKSDVKKRCEKKSRN